ncbi:MAG: phosphoenolpyruvate--protein phosphotransferase [Thermodesulfobacteriota bacterium]
MNSTEPQIDRPNRRHEPSDNDTNVVLKGIGVSGGIAIGQVVLIERVTTEIFPQCMLGPEEVSLEVDRFTDAVKEAAAQMREIKKSMARRSPTDDHLYILDSHIMLLEDRMFFQGTKDAIVKDKVNAEWALSEIVSGIIKAFETIEDEYLRERARDIHFVADRVMGILTGGPAERKLPQLPPNSVVVAHDMSPADTAQLPRGRVLGFAIDMGGRTSHTAIMARSLKIPAVTGLEKITRRVFTGDTIIVDGTTGVIIINPGPDVIIRYRDRAELYRHYTQSLMPFGRLPAVTRDGAHSVRIMANIEFLDEAPVAREHGCEGIGLFRTEYLFMGRSDLPSEEEQLAVYRRVVEENAPNPVTIRSLDVGGDKLSPVLNLFPETNPAMGLRAIRLCFARIDLFKSQLRAILRAGVYGNCRLLIPMISGLQEVRRTREILEEVKDQLRRDGLPFSEQVPLGILVEVPSAVAIADLLAKEVDFFSIGTNDLIQYTLAIDRLNEQVNYLYDTLHPAILRLIRYINEAGQVRGIQVAMCGEMAGDPLNVPILIGMGLSELSMNPLSIPLVKKLIRSVTIEECQQLTRRAFKMQSAEEIHDFLETWLMEHFPNDHFVSR